jgi:predicted nucleic acid-binding protein
LKVVADTNVIAYYLLGTEPYRGECGEFWASATDVLAPASWEAEVTNVLWMAFRTKVLDLAEAVYRLELVGSLAIRSYPVSSLWTGALVRACSTGISAYDTLFVELADREGLPLATFDRQLLRTFPSIAHRPSLLTHS